MARKYSPSVSKEVEGAMRKRKRGTLKSGGSGKKVTSRKQAIAIGLSEARQKGKKVPKKKSTSSSTSSSKKASGSKKSGTKKTGTEKSSSSRKSATSRKSAKSKK